MSSPLQGKSLGLDQKMEPPKSLQTGSATGNPRNKVALAPGHSLMDWIRLGNSGKDLTGVGGLLQDVSPDQLALHCTQDDAWLAIRDKVYNVTHYMNFHPGGQEELMRGVGKDATKLFTQVHAWVNYDSILKKCLVGRYRPRGGETNASDSENVCDTGKGLGEFLSSKEEKEKHSAASIIRKEAPRPLRWDWYEQEERGSMVLYCSSLAPAVCVSLGADDRDLRIEVRGEDRLKMLHFTLEKPVLWPPRIIQLPDSSKVEIQVRKVEAEYWKRMGVPCEDSDNEAVVADIPVTFLTMRIVHSLKINHNIQILGLEHTDRMINTVPMGHHVRVRAQIHGEEVVRPYTPVLPALLDPPSDWDPTLLCLMVKGYPDGALSSWLVAQPEGATLDVSLPEGNFQVNKLDGRKELYLLAAGTGFTPMVKLINWMRHRPTSKCEKICLLFFNRTPHDIFWKDELNKLQEIDKRFSVEHILSDADDSWTGRHGRMDGEVLRTFLPQRSPQIEPRSFVCICGPSPFTQLTKGLLQVMDYSEEDYHCFLG